MRGNGKKSWMGEESKARRGELGKRRPTYGLKEGNPAFIPLLIVIFPFFNEIKRELSREGVRFKGRREVRWSML